MTSQHTIQYGIRLPDGNMWRSPLSGAEVTWTERGGAEHVLEHLRTHAASMGMVFGGTVVRRYCTPFIDETDDGARLVEELTAWMRRETGGNS